jgi:hypothetical protein
MTSMTRQIAFNTGRTYTDKGQRIAARIFEEEPDGSNPVSIIAMSDIDRGIDGFYLIFDEMTQREVMTSYDNDLRVSVDIDWDKRNALFAELRKAAAVIPAVGTIAR